MSSKNKNKKAAHAGINILRDEKTGREYRVAVGPVQRIEWLAQLQDSGVNCAVLNLALAVTRFVNRGNGYAFAGDEEIGKLAGIKERTARLYIASLIEQGHLVRIRRGRSPSALYLVIDDRQENCRSKDEHDLQENCRSESASTGKATTLDRQNHDISTGKGHFSNSLKSDGSDRITQRITQRSNSENSARERNTDDFSPEKDAKPNKQPRGEKPPRGKADTPPPGFDEWWAAYPLHKARRDAERAYAKAIAGGATQQDLLLGAMRYAAERDREPDPATRAKFTAHPAKWLNRGSWADEPTPPPQSSSQRNHL